MKVSYLAREIERACTTLGLIADIGFELSKSDGSNVRTIARIRSLGSPNGMLVVTNLEQLDELSKASSVAEYGISMMGDSGTEMPFDLNSWRETFIDWGWSGDPKLKPAWMP